MGVPQKGAPNVATTLPHPKGGGPVGHAYMPWLSPALVHRDSSKEEAPPSQPEGA